MGLVDGSVIRLRASNAGKIPRMRVSHNTRREIHHSHRHPKGMTAAMKRGIDSLTQGENVSMRDETEMRQIGVSLWLGGRYAFSQVKLIHTVT
jgi:hypothetical protein